MPFAELQGVDLASMKMLQRMRILEEKGTSFATLALKDLPIIGEGQLRGCQSGDPAQGPAAACAYER